MILYGGRLSPFVRRVELWLAIQERACERRLVSVFETDFGGLLPLNPLGRVPVLVTDDGTSLFETFAITDYLDQTAMPERRLVAAAGPERWQQLQAISLAHGIAEKAVALVYENERRPPHLQWPHWRERIETQIGSGLAALDSLAFSTTSIRGTEIAAVCAFDMVACKFPVLASRALANLRQLSDLANADPAFARTHPSLA